MMLATTQSWLVMIEAKDFARFWSKVAIVGDCWLWTAGCRKNGYGTFWYRYKNVLAHRFAYNLLVGPVPAGLVLDHTCLVKSCVNPTHLDPVTRIENSRRSDRGARRESHCKYGHPMAAPNIYVTPRGKRTCRACRRRNVRDAGRRRRAKARNG